MKKISVILVATLIFVSVFSFSSCNESLTEKLTAFGVYSNAMAKQKALDSFEADMTVNMDMDISIMDTYIERVSLTYNMKAANLKGTAPVASADMTMSVMGMNAGVNIYTDGSYTYIDSMGVKMKLDPDSEEAEDYNVLDSVGDLAADFTEDFFESAEFSVNEDGTKTIKMTLTQEHLEKYLPDIIKNVADSQENVDLENVSISDVQYEAVIAENGYFSKINLVFDMEIEIDALGTGDPYTLTAQVEYSIDYKNPGAEVTVTAPEDLDEYIPYEDIVTID